MPDRQSVPSPRDPAGSSSRLEPTGLGVDPPNRGSRPASSRAQRLIAADAARRWARRPLDVETVLLLDPDGDEADRITTEMLSFGIRLVYQTEPFRAIARIAAGGVDLLLVNASVGADQLQTIITVVRQESSIPVLLAHGPDDHEVLTSAVLAGARPLISLPYDPRELAQVLRSAVPVHPRGRRIEVGALSIVIDSYDAAFAGRGVDLSRLEFEVLVALARDAGHVVPRLTLIRALWPDSHRPEDLLGSAVSRIRRKLEPLGVSDAIHTVRGLGYRLDPASLTVATAEAQGR